MNVIEFKLRRKAHTDSATALAAIDNALGEVFVRLGERYGPYAVTTVALKYVTEAVAHARLKHLPNEDAWIADLAQQFIRATRESSPTE